jgi:hypothetical protein
MNEDLKRLIEVLNKAGYEVIAFEDRDSDLLSPYLASGVFSLKVFDTSKDKDSPSKQPVSYA